LRRWAFGRDGQAAAVLVAIEGRDDGELRAAVEAAGGVFAYTRSPSRRRPDPEVQFVVRMHELGTPINEIARLLGLPVERVRSIAVDVPMTESLGHGDRSSGDLLDVTGHTAGHDTHGHAPAAGAAEMDYGRRGMRGPFSSSPLLAAVAARTGGHAPVAAASPSDTQPPVAQATESQPTPPQPSPTPSISSTCSDSEAWARSGEADLLDAYIQNQNSGKHQPGRVESRLPAISGGNAAGAGRIGGGDAHAVPSRGETGTYETTSSDIEGCYWERGRTVRSSPTTSSPLRKVKQRVTIRASDDTFVSRDCGDWSRWASPSTSRAAPPVPEDWRGRFVVLIRRY